MSLPTRGSRNIHVDGVHYRWWRGSETGHSTLCVQRPSDEEPLLAPGGVALAWSVCMLSTGKPVAHNERDLL